MCCVFQDTDTLWLDYHQNIADKSLSSLDTYLAQFPDIKVRITFNSHQHAKNTLSSFLICSLRYEHKSVIKDYKSHLYRK